MSPSSLRVRVRPCVSVFVLLLTGCSSSCIDPMKAQPKYEAYEPSNFFADGRAMQDPPAGTVPRERQLGAPALTDGLAPDGGWTAENPVPLTREALERGRHKFEVLCATCHGLLGDGDSMPARKMALRPPPSLHDFADRPDGFFYGAITRGWGFMPSYAADLSVEERWEVVAYVRALIASQRARLEQAPPDVQRQLREAKSP